MKKSEKKIIYVCDNCGAEHIRWQGRCSSCQAWNSLKEFSAISVLDQKSTKLDFFQSSNVKSNLRFNTKIEEFDRVVGGGVVPGSLILLGGEPGIGKSTLVLELVKAFQKLSTSAYLASGEESGEQISLRCQRLGVIKPKILISSDIDAIISTALKNPPQILVIDSIQVMRNKELATTPGSITQIKESTLKLQNFAKTYGVVVFIIGHVTKEGVIAGPKIIEHLVDVVMYLEGDQTKNLRILRCTKNRFGSINEIGIFEMSKSGLVEVKNPSEFFLKDRLPQVSGSITTVIIEGSRPILVEVQALVSKTIFGYPKRSSSGIDLVRLQLLCAVIEARLGIPASSYDIYVNIAGDLKVTERAAELAVVLSIISAIKQKPIDKNLVAFGEIGLSGEIRTIPQIYERIRESTRLGFKKIISPKLEKKLKAKYNVVCYQELKITISEIFQ